jgi:hypothetical protein
VRDPLKGWTRKDGALVSTVTGNDDVGARSRH